MTEDAQHWITLHRVRFPNLISVEDRTFQPPSPAECWRFCPSHGMKENGLPAWNSDIWGGLGIYETREDAEAVFNNPVAHLPWLEEASEAWHALAVPIAHHGEVNWRGTPEIGSALRTGTSPVRGCLVVITTAGYASRDPSQIPRIARFMQGVQDVTDFYGTLPGNLCVGVFNGGFDGRDGFTLTVWNDDGAMVTGAYKPGVHKALLDESRDGSMFDRSSFTRARLVASGGSWAGSAVGALA